MSPPLLDPGGNLPPPRPIHHCPCLLAPVWARVPYLGPWEEEVEHQEGACQGRWTCRGTSQTQRLAWWSGLSASSVSSSAAHIFCYLYPSCSNRARHHGRHLYLSMAPGRRFYHLPTVPMINPKHRSTAAQLHKAQWGRWVCPMLSGPPYP